jgi:hypothetical protein
MSVYLKYFSALQWKLFIPFLLFFVCAKGADIYSNIWLAQWTNYTSTLNSSAVNHSDVEKENNKYLGIFGGIGSGEGKSHFCRGFVRSTFAHRVAILSLVGFQETRGF